MGGYVLHWMDILLGSWFAGSWLHCGGDSVPTLFAEFS
jgi:hypothetical protein